MTFQWVAAAAWPRPALATGDRVPGPVLKAPPDLLVEQGVVWLVDEQTSARVDRARRAVESLRQARTQRHTSCHCAPRCRMETPSSRRTHERSRRSTPSGRSRTPTGGLATTP